MKKQNDKEREKFNNFLESLDFEKHKAILGEPKSSRYRQFKTNFKKRTLGCQGAPFIVPFNIGYIYTRLEVLLGLKLSGYTHTLTQASKLFDEIYKRGEIQI